MGVSMFVQMKMNPEPTDPVQKQMFTWMPVIFTFMLGSFPVRSRDLLDLEQYAVGAAAIAHHGAGGREDRALGQSRQYVPQEGDRKLIESPPRTVKACRQAAICDGQGRGEPKIFEETGRKLFAQPCDFIWAATDAAQSAAAGRARNRIRRPLQCRQILAAQRADQPQCAGPRPRIRRDARKP